MTWRMQPVSEMCILAVDCVNKTAPTVDYETPYEMIRTTNVKGGFIHLDEVKYVTEEVFEKWTRRSRPRYGDVVLTREAPVGEVGRCTFTDRNIFLGQRIFHYRPDPEKLDWNFLAYALQSWEVQGRFRGMGFGATVHHVKVGDAENLLIPCPPLMVQRKIGGLLGAYDDLIENNRRRIELLKEAARLLYREWFVHFRFPGHEHVKIADGLPEGWERPAASAVMEVLSGGTPKTGNSAFWDGKIGFFTPKDATDTPYVLGTEKTITEEGLRACNSQLYPVDTLFITARGTVGKLNLALIPMAMNQSCYALRAKSYFGQRYLYVALRAAIEQIRARATGAVFDAIIVATFNRIPFLLPPEKLTRNFEQSIDPMFDQIANLIQQNWKLAQARDLLLPRLMNGEIAV